jgi:nucleotide-binding universal stress UspA family protein
MLTLRAILHPTDFSAGSREAFRLACTLAQDHGARLVLLHVMWPPAFGEGGALMLDQFHENALAELRRLPVPEGVGVEQHVGVGRPASEVVRVAQETGCDLIVMGTHGRSGIRRLLMGSVAEKVMRTAPCPVLTVKASVNPPTSTRPLASSPSGAEPFEHVWMDGL